MILAIDFDHVIHDIEHPIQGRRMGAPMLGTKDALDRLKRQGHTIIVFTVRGSSENKKHVEEFMTYYKLPFDEVTNIKKKADYYVDNKGIRFHNWTDTMEAIK